MGRNCSASVRLPARLAGYDSGVVSLTRGVLIAALAADVLLVLAGLTIVPETLGSFTGVGAPAADIALLLGIGAAAMFGPGSLDRLSGATAPCLAVGVVFAVSYAGLLLLDFAGRPLPVNPLYLFIAGGLIASACAGYTTRRISQGVLAGAWALVLGTAMWSAGLMTIAYSFWGTRPAYQFWQRDGAVSEYHRSGGSDFSVFLLQDIQGAIFFHPLLSVAIGAALGLIGAGVGLTTVKLRAAL
jgi:hypothetical protein